MRSTKGRPGRPPVWRIMGSVNSRHLCGLQVWESEEDELLAEPIVWPLTVERPRVQPIVAAVPRYVEDSRSNFEYKC